MHVCLGLFLCVIMCSSLYMPVFFVYKSLCTSINIIKLFPSILYPKNNFQHQLYSLAKQCIGYNEEIIFVISELTVQNDNENTCGTKFN